MSKEKSLSKRFFEHIQSFTVGENDYEYAINFGMISSFFLFAKTLISILFRDPSIFASASIYLVLTIVSGLVFLLVSLIHIDLIKRNSSISKIIMYVYPYVIVIILIAIALSYSNVVNQQLSFFAGLIVLSWAQIYRIKKRTIIYSLSFLLYFGGYLVFQGYNSGFFDYFSVGLMGSILGFVTASILYEIYSHKELIIDRLEKTNKELRQSHNVTASMLNITEEVLRNEHIEAILQLVLDEAMNLIPNSQAGSILIKEDEDTFAFAAAREYRLEKLQSLHLKYGELYQSSLKDPFEPFIIKNLEVFDEVHIGKEKTKEIWSGSQKIAKSCMTCSFRYNGEFYGAINIDNFDREDIYEKKDMYLLKQLAKELEIIISIHKLYEKALRPTRIDELTEAYTRTYCMKLLKKTIAKGKGKQIAITTLDIDQLKQINDMYGHDVGDRYLRFFADAVRNVNLSEHIFGRVGGDEFLLIFIGKDRLLAEIQVEHIRKYLKKHFFIPNGHGEEVSFSAGIAVYPTEGEDINELIKLSDKRMYIDKRERLHS